MKIGNSKKKKKKKKKKKRRLNADTGRKEANVLFNDAFNTFFIYCYMVKNHSDSERGNPLPPHGLLFPISSKVGFFICIIPQTG